MQVQRVLNGQRGKRITVDFADSIARATNDAVPITAWVSKAIPEASGSSPIVDETAAGEEPEATGTGDR